MQDLLSRLSPPLAIALIVAGILVLAVVIFLARRRRRQANPEEGGSTGLGGAIDYTSMPLDEEPQNFRDRFNNLSLPGKLLVILAPILGLLLIGVLLLALLPGGNGGPPVATAVPVTISFSSEPAVIRPQPQTIGFSVRTTGVSDDTELTVEMLEDGQPFAWFDPAFVNPVVRRNRADIQIPRAENAPQPSEGREYTIVVRGPGDVSQQAPLTVPEINAGAFFGSVAEAPTRTVAPTTPPATAAPSPEATAVPSPEATAAPELPTGQPVGVTNGGNVRRLPFLADNRIGGVNAGSEVQIIQRTPNGSWYYVRFTDTDDNQEKLGWISASLLAVDTSTAAQVPVAPIVSVFENGAVYEQPDLSSTQIDRVNAGASVAESEVVELRRKTADGSWYEIVNVRDITGWVPAELLGIPDDIAAQVPNV